MTQSPFGTKSFASCVLLLVASQLLFIACEEPPEIQGPALFEKTIGYTNYDECYDILELNSGDIVAVGYSGSGGLGEADFLLQRLSPDGSPAGDSFYGGPQFDQCYATLEDDDNNIYLGGLSNSWGQGYTDYHVVKLNDDGEALWSQTFGSPALEVAYDMIWTENDDLLLSGSYQETPHANYDVGVVGLDKDGEKLWGSHFGGPGDEVIRSSCLTDDGHIILAGWSNSSTTEDDDMFLAKLDGSGNVLWEKAFDSGGIERCHDVLLCDDGGFLLAGYRFIDFEKNRDLYLIKTDSDGTIIWDCTFGGELNEEAWAVQQDPWGAFYVSGFSESFSAGGNDAYLVKVSQSGRVLGHKHFGGVSHDYSRSMQIARNGDVLLGGYSYSTGAGVSDFYIVRTDTTVNPL